MSDTATISVPAVLHAPTRVAVCDPEAPRRRELFASLGDVELRLAKLEEDGCEYQLVVLAPGLFALEWR